MATAAQAYNLPQNPAMGGGNWGLPSGMVPPPPQAMLPPAPTPYQPYNTVSATGVGYKPPQLPQVPQLSLDDLRNMMGAGIPQGGNTPQPTQSTQAAKPPMSLPDYLTQEEQRLGVKKLTPDQAQQAADDFGKAFVAPNYWSLPGANKERVASEMGAYSVAAQHAIDKYNKAGAPAQAPAKQNTFGDIVDALHGAGLETAGTLEKLLGGVYAGGRQLLGASPQQMDAIRNNIFGAADATTAAGQQLINKGQQGSPILGTVAAGAGGIPGMFITGGQQGALEGGFGNAAVGNSLGHTLSQYGIDSAIGALLQGLGASGSGASGAVGKVLDTGLSRAQTLSELGLGKYGKTAAAVGSGTTATGANVANQVADAAINPTNPNNLSLQDVLRQFGTNTALSLLLSRMHGGEPQTPGAPMQGETKAPPTSAPPMPGTAAPTDTAAAASTPIDTNAPSNVGAQLQTMVSADAHSTGMDDKTFAKQTKAYTNDLAVSSKGKSRAWGRAANDSTTPEAAVVNAMTWTRKAIPDDAWNAMNAEQRQSLVEQTAVALGAKSKLDPQAISDVITAKNEPAAPAAQSSAPATETQAPAPQQEAAPAPLQEQPTPPGLEGQAPTTQAAPAAPAATPADQAQQLWSALTTKGPAQDALLGTDLGKQLSAMQKSGALTGPDALEAALTQLQQGAKANPFKATKTPAQQHAERDTTAKIVTEALTGDNTPQTVKNKLQQRVRANIDKRSPPTPPEAPATEAPATKKPLKGATQSPKGEAPVANTGAATALEGEIRAQLPELSNKAVDELHDAIANARMGDKHDLGDILDAWQTSGDLSKEDAKWVRGKAKEGAVAPKALKAKISLKDDLAEAKANESESNDDYFNDYQNNASGESSASLEAQNRLRDERAAGQTRAVIRNDGSVEPLTGVDAVDTRARNGEVVVQRGVGKDDWTVLSHGNDLNKDLAAGKINRARADLDKLHASVAPVRDIDVPGFGKVTIDQTHDVQLLGGSPNKSDKFYADKDWNPIAPVRKLDGSVADMDRSPFLGVHELLERKLEQQGEGYTEAHRQAEDKESEEVRKAGFDPESYQDSFTKDVASAAKKVNGNPPPDIVEKPYEHPHSVRAREALKNVQEHEDTGGAGPHGEYTLPIEDLEGLEDKRDQMRKQTGENADNVAPLQVKRRVNKITDAVRNGADIHETGQELKKLSDDIEKAKQEKAMRDALRTPQRGVEYVRSRLQKMISESSPGDDHYEAGKFALWLLDKNPNLANSLGIRIRALESNKGMKDGPAGMFNPLDRVFHINSQSTNPGTAVHEIMHSAEQLMPPELKNAIHDEYIGRLQNKLKQTIKNGNKAGQRYTELALQNYVHPSREAVREMNLLLRTQRKTLPLDEFYKYHNPSEYWAVESTRLLNDRWIKNGLADRARQWLQGFFEHVKSLLGIDNNHAISKALDAILKSPGEEYHEGMLAQGRRPADEQVHDFNNVQEDEDEDEESEQHATDEDEETSAEAPANQSKRAATVAAEQAPDNGTRGSLGRVNNIVEKMMNAHVGVEESMQGLRRAGVEINDDNNVDSALVLGRGIAQSMGKDDDYDVNRPAREWIDKNYARFDGNKNRFVDNLNKFFGNKTQFERIRSSWLEDAPLKSLASDIEREKILDRLNDSKNYAQRKSIYKELEKLTPDMTMTADEWGEANDQPVKQMRDTLAELKSKYGMDEKSMGDLNKIAETARQRLHDRLVQSGDVASDDAWADARGWEWYVPAKSAHVEGANDDAFDAASHKIKLKGLNQSLRAMEGRESYAEKPFNRLFVDVLRAGQKVGDKQPLNAIKELVTDSKTRKLLGASVKVYDGTPYEGYTDASGKEFRRLPLGMSDKDRLRNVVIHEGRTHFVVKFPADSKMLRGLLQSKNIEAPSAIGKAVSRYTNTLARGYTTLRPAWMHVAFLRDLNYVPLSLAANKFDNPLQAVPFFGRYAVNVIKEMAAAKRLVPELKGDMTALRAMAAKDPNSEAGWFHRYAELGGANAFTNGYDIAGMDNQMKSLSGLPKDAKGLLQIPKRLFNTALKYTGRYADFLTQIPRVAAFRTGVEMGWGEREAATQARRVLDYTESGTLGRRMNAWLAFSRVAMTSVDDMRRSFTKPTGEFDYVKLAKWFAFFTALGAMQHMASTAILGQDEDGKDVMAKMEPDTIGSSFLFPVGDNIASWQVGLGLPQLMMAPGALGAAVEMGHMTPEEAVQAYYRIATRNLAFEPGGMKENTPAQFAASLIKGVVPTVARPIVDLGDNVTNYGYPIHPEAKEGQYHSDIYGKSTPQDFIDMAQWLNKTTHGEIDFYPQELEYLVKNYGGQWGSVLVNDMAGNNKSQGGGTLDVRGASIPGFVHDQDFYQQRELSETMDTLGDAAKRYSAIIDHATDNGATTAEAKQQANNTLRQNPDLAKQIQLYDQLKKARSERAAAMRELQQNKLMSQQGKQLQQKQIDSRLRQVLERVQSQMPQ